MKGGNQPQMRDSSVGWRFRETLRACREIRHRAKQIPRKSLISLDGLRIAFSTVAVAFIGKEVTRYGWRELDVLAQPDEFRVGHDHSAGAGRGVWRGQLGLTGP